MCNTRSQFISFGLLSHKISIPLGDRTVVVASEGGEVRLATLTINAIYVPEFRVSLVSVGELDRIGLKSVFANGTCRIWEVGKDRLEKVILHADYREGLYVLEVPAMSKIPDSCSELPVDFLSAEATISSNLAEKALSAKSHKVTPDLILWHRRLGHLNQDSLKHFFTNTDLEKEYGKVPSLGSEGPTTTSCTTCILSKQRRSHSSKPVTRATVPFQLIHSDSCGPLPISFGGSRYYILYIDEFTRYVFVYFLKTKGSEECTSSFEHLLNYLKTQYSQYPVQRFRSDNGRGEYSNRCFQDLLGQMGIVFQPSPPYTQDKNGLAERMIQTINSKARSLLIDAALPIRFWSEAVNTAVYLHRISPSSSLGNQSPLQVLIPNSAPPVAHLRRFGCVAYHRMPDDARSGSEVKFTPRAKLCMMLGYTDSSKIWRLWDFTGNGIAGRPIHSSNVIFVENENAMIWYSKPEATGVGDLCVPAGMPTNTGLKARIFPSTSEDATTPIEFGLPVVPLAFPEVQHFGQTLDDEFESPDLVTPEMPIVEENPDSHTEGGQLMALFWLLISLQDTFPWFPLLLMNFLIGSVSSGGVVQSCSVCYPCLRT